MSNSIRQYYEKETEELSSCLFDALYELMQTCTIDQLSVSQIIQHAHVSRASFYRRYKDKYDLLNHTYEQILKKTLFNVKTGSTWKQSIYLIYKVIYDNAVFFKNALTSEDPNSLSNYIYEQGMHLESEILEMNGIDTTEPAVHYRLASYVAGGLELTIIWLKDDVRLPLNELVEILFEMVPDMFKEYFI